MAAYDVGEPVVRGLDELLCFDLYAASRAVTALYRPLLDELGLTYPQYLVLVTLQPGRSLGVGEIAAELSLDHATLTPLLRRMEGAGLVTRRRSSADERRVAVALTEAGQALRLRFDDVQCVVGEALGLDPEEFRRLQESLRSLTRAVRRHPGAPGERGDPGDPWDPGDPGDPGDPAAGVSDR